MTAEVLLHEQSYPAVSNSLVYPTSSASEQQLAGPVPQAALASQTHFFDIVAALQQKPNDAYHYALVAGYCQVNLLFEVGGKDLYFNAPEGLRPQLSNTAQKLLLEAAVRYRRTADTENVVIAGRAVASLRIWQPMPPDRLQRRMRADAAPQPVRDELTLAY